jgi:1-aminocyclopropane-1-carboxylate deaminase
MQRVSSLFQNQIIQTSFALKTGRAIQVIQDKSFANLGTKLRKAKGILSDMQRRGFSKISLYGHPNSNFMGAFSLFFSSYGIEVCSVYKKIYGHKNINFHLTKKFSCNMKYLETKDDLLALESKLLKQGYYILPEYGLCLPALLGLETLWEQISFHPNQAFVLDIGSGLSLLSLLNYLSNKNISFHNIIGVCIGLPVARAKAYLNQISKKLLNKEWDLSHLTFLKPSIYPSFGKQGRVSVEYANWAARQGLYLEPVYSVKTMVTLEDFLKNQVVNREVIYLHQGGMPSSINSF